MALTIKVTNVDATQNQFIVDGIITPSGNYGTSGGVLPHGDTLNLTDDLIKSNAVPNLVEVWSSEPSGSAPLNDLYWYLPGTTAANGILQITLAGTEFTPGNPYSGASPTNVAGYKLYFRAWFPSFA